ncbi:Diaminopimelate epimerase-like protein [Biscogniauxia sp. FL1348]|nr:Diaminopimelate epimerase-like protein [Biscogniauxia sp. FL1348]
MDLPFVTLDVFTNTLHRGNPLAVVMVPESLRSRITQRMKQNVAKDFNFSETVFLHEPFKGDGNDDDAREIDIFTTDREIPFAGHPTIGTAVLLRYFYSSISRELSWSATGGLDIRKLITKAGPIDIHTAPNHGIRAKIPHNVHLHAKTLADAIGPVAQAEGERLGLSANPEIRAAELGAPVFSIVNGMTFLLIQLPSLELLRQVPVSNVDLDGLRESLLDEGWRESFVGKLYYVDVDADAKDSTEDVRHFRARMIEFGSEDPATGSAASALGAYLTLTEKKGGRRFRITQGVEMGRESTIDVETTTIGEGDSRLDELWLGGTAVVATKGSTRV